MTQLQQFLEAVNDNLTGVIESIRDQKEVLEDRERARREEAEKLRQEHLAQNNRLTEFALQNITSTPLRAEHSRTQLPDTAFHSTARTDRQT